MLSICYVQKERMKTVKITVDYKGMVTLAKKDGLGLLILIFKNNLILKYFFSRNPGSEN